MITMALDKRSSLMLKRLSQRFPRQTYKGMGRAAASVRAKLRKVMRNGGGIEGVPEFNPADPDTDTLNEYFGREERKLGGKLTMSSAIQMFRNGRGNLTIGFITPLEAYARMFQTEDNRPLSEGERLIYRNAMVDSDSYNRPARPILEPFSKAIRRDFLRWTIRATQKILQKEAKK